MQLEVALVAVKGKIEDKAAFVRALAPGPVLETSPIGPIFIDEFGKPVLNIYVRKVERKGRQAGEFDRRHVSEG